MTGDGGRPGIVDRRSAAPLGHQDFLALSWQERCTYVRAATPPWPSPSTTVLGVVTLGRVRTCFVGVVTFALGTTQVAGQPATTLVAGAVLAFLIAFVGNLLNATADVEEDAVNLPGRLLVVARLGLGRVVRLSYAACAAMIVGGFAIGLWFGVVMAVATLGMVQYSTPPLRAKSHPFVGLLLFCQAAGMPFALGVLVPSTGSGWAAAPAVTDLTEAVAYWVCLSMWFFGKGLVKNVPDYYGDREGGVRTSATIFPSRRAAAMVAVAGTVASYLVFAVLPVLGLPVLGRVLVLAWTGVALANGRRLVACESSVGMNTVLRHDMFISLGFVATLTLARSTGPTTVAAVLASVVAVVAIDLVGLDSRSNRHADEVAPSAPAPGGGGR